MSRPSCHALCVAVVLLAACEARQPDGRAVDTAASKTATPTITVSAPATSPSPPPPPRMIVPLTQSGGVPRFGLVARLRNGHTCLTIEGDSLTDSTAVATVAYHVSENGDSSQTAIRALVVGYSAECTGTLDMLDGRKFALHSASDAPLGEGVGIVGGIDTLTVIANRAVARFPGDTAHWSFDVCSSHEGLHYGVDRMSADSIVTLWDGYWYLGYDTVPDCREARAIPRAAEVRALAAAWRSGQHDEETAMRLVIARWDQCSHDKDYGPDPDSSTSARLRLPPMSALLEAAGSPGKLSAENQFVLGWLAGSDEDCFENALPRSAKEIRAEAVLREPSSLVFHTFGAGIRTDFAKDSVRAEIHRRFDGRGEHYRYLADWLRSQL